MRQRDVEGRPPFVEPELRSDYRVLSLALIDPRRTYNFEVDQTHTDFVTEARIWVHNLDNIACKNAREKLLKKMSELGGEMSDDEILKFLKRTLLNVSWFSGKWNLGGLMLVSGE